MHTLLDWRSLMEAGWILVRGAKVQIHVLGRELDFMISKVSLAPFNPMIICSKSIKRCHYKDGKEMAKWQKWQKFISLLNFSEVTYLQAFQNLVDQILNLFLTELVSHYLL